VDLPVDAGDGIEVGEFAGNWDAATETPDSREAAPVVALDDLAGHADTAFRQRVPDGQRIRQSEHLMRYAVFFRYSSEIGHSQSAPQHSHVRTSYCGLPSARVTPTPRSLAPHPVP